MKEGDLVRIATTSHPHAKSYPKGVGVVTIYIDQGLHEMYNTAYVLWPGTGEERPVKVMFLELVDESG